MNYYIHFDNHNFPLKKWVRENYNLIDGYVYIENDTTNQIVAKFVKLGWINNTVDGTKILSKNIMMNDNLEVALISTKHLKKENNNIFLKNIYTQKKATLSTKGKKKDGFEYTSFDQFLNWFNQDVFENGCHYCGTTNEESGRLYNFQRNGLRPDATRGGKRGKRLELDRVDPNDSYDNLNNLVWCCYWCNNAKTNFFTAEEFKPIAKEIGNQLKNILNQNEVIE